MRRHKVSIIEMPPLTREERDRLETMEHRRVGHPLGRGANHDEEHYLAHAADDGLAAYRGARMRGKAYGEG